MNTRNDPDSEENQKMTRDNERDTFAAKMDTPRENIAGKPVLWLARKRILNLNSGFQDKLLCDGPTFTAGDACVYSCAFCYVPSAMQAKPPISEMLAEERKRFDEVVIRRENPLDVLRTQLFHSNGKPKYPDPLDARVVYASPLVDVAATLEMCRETTAICEMILENTHWHIRLLSKSSFLPLIAGALEKYRDRMIYGVSTGTLDDMLAAAFEQGTALVSKRIQSLHKLQDQGFRTFGMICPSLPFSTIEGYAYFAQKIAEAIRADRCEHVWAEVMNVRGESMRRTVKCLREAGYDREASELFRVSTSPDAWEDYARNTFRAHANYIPKGKLRFLQYVSKANLPWWQTAQAEGAVLLGALIHG